MPFDVPVSHCLARGCRDYCGSHEVECKAVDHAVNGIGSLGVSMLRIRFMMNGHASEADAEATDSSAADSSDSSSILPIRSCLIGGSSEDALDDVTSSSPSIFLLLPFGAGSKGVRQYVTVRVTT